MEPFAIFDAPCEPDLLLQQEERPPQSLLTVDGISMLGRYEGREFVVERLLSTNPFDYLNCQPGARLSC